jgi:hypothetical protein
MSDADIELVRALQPAPDVDLAVLFADPATWASFEASAGPLFVGGFECAGIGGPQGDLEATGLDGLRELWTEWLSPWVSYHTTIEDVVGSGEMVMVLVHDRAVSRHDGVKVELRGASIWTMQAGRIARVEFHTHREGARAAFEGA